MRARELATPVVVVRPSEPAGPALRAVGAARLPGLVVAGEGGYVVVPASQLLRAALPRYVLDDVALRGVVDEATADALGERLRDVRVADLLRLLEPLVDVPEPVVDGDATLAEIATVMAAAHVPLVVVVDRGELLGAVSAHDVIARLLP